MKSSEFDESYEIEGRESFLTISSFYKGVILCYSKCLKCHCVVCVLCVGADQTKCIYIVYAHGLHNNGSTNFNVCVCVWGGGGGVRGVGQKTVWRGVPKSVLDFVKG